MKTKPYLQQLTTWPSSGRHILAQFDNQSIVVYQAYRPAIAEYAVKYQRFGGEFSYNRMSWIKPNFLWMMYRAGWAQKEGQERILAIRLRISFFDEILSKAVASTYDPTCYANRDEWQHAIANSDVRLQWDPDHNPAGKEMTRRAIQLGLRGNILRRYGEKEIVSIHDITNFVAEQQTNANGDFASLQIPEESVYVPSAFGAKNIGLEQHG